MLVRYYDHHRPIKRIAGYIHPSGVMDGCNDHNDRILPTYYTVISNLFTKADSRRLSDPGKVMRMD